MSFILFAINSLLLALAVVNFLSMRRTVASGEIDSTVTILLPVRNEEENIVRILRELDSQVNLPLLKILVIDDNSDDQTLSLIHQNLTDRISVISAPPLPQGWLGKVSALQAGFRHIESNFPDVVISIDADVHFEPDAIVRATSTLLKTELDFISPYPRQIAQTWAERLVQPLLQWSWMSTVLLRGAEKFPNKSTVICNGQFLLMRGSSLKDIGGFESVAQKVLDDIELGRSFVEAGFKGTVMSGSDISSTRMYQSFAEIRAGYGKSLHRAFGSLIGSIFAALFVGFTALAPIVYAVNGDALATAAFFAIIATRVVSAASSGTRIRDSLLHPISALLFIYLLYFSWSNRGKTQWKGRTL